MRYVCITYLPHPEVMGKSAESDNVAQILGRESKNVGTFVCAKISTELEDESTIRFTLVFIDPLMVTVDFIIIKLQKFYVQETP